MWPPTFQIVLGITTICGENRGAFAESLVDMRHCVWGLRAFGGCSKWAASVTQWSTENQVPFIGESVSNIWMKALKQEKMTNLGSRTDIGKPQLRMIVPWPPSGYVARVHSSTRASKERPQSPHRQP